MPNFIPTMDDDQLPQKIRAQFEMIQNIIKKEQNNSSKDENEGDSRSNNEATRTALSLALSVQYEIDVLLKGISELENILDDKDQCDATYKPFSITNGGKNENISHCESKITMIVEENKNKGSNEKR